MSDGSPRFTPFTMEEKTVLSWALEDFRKAGDRRHHASWVGSAQRMSNELSAVRGHRQWLVDADTPIGPRRYLIPGLDSPPRFLLLDTKSYVVWAYGDDLRTIVKGIQGDRRLVFVLSHMGEDFPHYVQIELTECLAPHTPMKRILDL